MTSFSLIFTQDPSNHGKRKPMVRQTQEAENASGHYIVSSLTHFKKNDDVCSLSLAMSLCMWKQTCVMGPFVFVSSPQCEN